jgi:preprotein translocase subunit YajC
MAELVYEETLKFSHDLVVGDEINVGGLHAEIEKVVTNHHDDLVLHLKITGATIKKRSKMMLIIPKKTPITTLK